MRLYICNNKNRFWNAFFLFCLVVTFLAPSVHSHDIGHDDGVTPHAHTRNVAAATHSHAVHHTGERHNDNLFVPDADVTDFSKHDHNTNQHSHFSKNLLLRVQRVDRGLEELKPFVLHSVSVSLDSLKISYQIFNQLAPIKTPAYLEYIFIASALPPPIA